MSTDEDDTERHESYGLVSFSRRTGNPGTLFGSPLTDHGAYITLSIKRGVRITSGGSGTDRFYSSIRGDIVEVDMSPAQFAELLTTMNIGMGVPCTIRAIENKRVENPPAKLLEVEKVQLQYKKHAKEAADALVEGQREVDELLQKKTLSKQERSRISWVIGKVRQHLESTAPFMLEMFEEAAQKITSHAKAEVDAFVTHNLLIEGIRAVTERVQAPQLPEGVGDKKPELKE